MCAVYGTPGNLTDEQMLYLWLNLPNAKELKANQYVESPSDWATQSMSEQDILYNKLLSMM